MCPCTLRPSLVVGVSSFYTCKLIKEKLNVDDVLDVFGLQTIPGVLGALLVSFGASTAEIPTNQELVYQGIFFGGPAVFFGVQLLGAAVVCAWTALTTYGLMQVVVVVVVGVGVSFHSLFILFFVFFFFSFLRLSAYDFLISRLVLLTKSTLLISQRL